MKIKDSLGYTICRVARKIHQRITGEFSVYDMPLAQWVTLKTVSENDGISLKQLSGLLEKDQNNVKAMVDRLDKKGFLQRKVNAADKRAFSLFVTQEGSRMVTELAARDERAIAQIEQPLTEAETQLFLSFLARIEKQLDEVKEASTDQE